MNKTEQSVFDTAVKLCKANNTVSTLEIKNDLRKNVPGKWFQSDVSDIMDSFASKGKFTYSDNGIHRTYTLVGTKTTTKAPVTQTGRSSKISRTKAIELIEKSKGHFFTVTFVKKDNSERVMNAQYSSKTAQAQAKLGYITLKDVSEKGVPKNVNTQTIKALSMGGTTYTIK